MPSFEYLFNLAIGTVMIDFLGVEHAFRLAAAGSSVFDPSWRSALVQRQLILRLSPIGNIMQVIGWFSSARLLDFFIADENQVASVGLIIGTLPNRIRRLNFNLLVLNSVHERVLAHVCVNISIYVLFA